MPNKTSARAARRAAFTAKSFRRWQAGGFPGFESGPIEQTFS
jgi:hypothetical protein